MVRSEEPKIKAIAPWFGGKRMLASRIIAELGVHKAYFEPFCGSLAVLLAKPKCGQETVCDLHRELTNLAWVLQSDYAGLLYGRLSRTLCSEALYEQAMRLAVLGLGEMPEGSVNEEHLSRAYWFFILSWLGRNGTSGSVRQDFAMATRWTPGGGSGGKRFVSAVESIPAWHQRLREVTILNRDAFDVIPRISDEDGVAIYVDPPYLRSTRSGNGGGSRYLHDFDETGGLLGPDDHERLAEQLRRFTEVRVVLSYYDNPRLAELYPGWTQINCATNKQLHMQNKRGAEAVEAPEVLLVNGPSNAEPGPPGRRGSRR